MSRKTPHLKRSSMKEEYQLFGASHESLYSFSLFKIPSKNKTSTTTMAVLILL